MDGMSESPALSTTVVNVPNVLTAGRIALSPLLFVLLALDFYPAALALFAVAAFTDWLDGWWARTFNEQTVLGRILDPLADKLIICGTAIFLAAEPAAASRIAPWMAVVLVGRELIVTALRSLVEERGIDFSSSWAGKLKMVVQVAALGGSLLLLALGDSFTPVWLLVAVDVLIWLAIGLTLWSGAEYLVAAIRILSTDEPAR